MNKIMKLNFAGETIYASEQEMKSIVYESAIDLATDNWEMSREEASVYIEAATSEIDFCYDCNAADNIISAYKNDYATEAALMAALATLKIRYY